VIMQIIDQVHYRKAIFELMRKGGNIVLEDCGRKFYRYTEISGAEPQYPAKVLCDLKTATVSFAFLSNAVFDQWLCLRGTTIPRYRLCRSLIYIGYFQKA
jgi:hypothetical protein